MTRRHSPPWMTLLDERILEHLDEERWSTVSYMSEHRWIPGVKEAIRSRCGMLEVVGLIDQIAEEAYGISDEGILYLDGDHEPGSLPQSIAADVLADVLKEHIASTGSMPSRMVIHRHSVSKTSSA